MRHIAMALTASAILTTGADGFQINPMKNKYRGNDGSGFWEQITEPVHEDITDAAVRCADEHPTADPAAPTPLCAPEDIAPSRSGRGNKYDAVIRGVWWPDDPNQRLYSIHAGTWLAWMNDAQTIAKKGHNWLGRSTAINATYKMHYRSHYGDLQFLHAMASADGQPAADIQRDVSDWIAFIYRVATGTIDAETTLAEVPMPIVARYFTRQSGWTVNHLFAPNYTLGRATIPDVALGATLHAIEDSFSAAHTDRTAEASKRCPNGRIREFHAYIDQSPSRHGQADVRSAWRSGANQGALLNPVEMGARMILFVRQKADWDRTVAPYLRSTMFCVDDDARPASGGDFG